MKRREFLELGVAAAAMLPLSALGQGAAPAPGQSGLLVYSRNLQWLRTPQELGKAIQEIGLDRVDLTVLPNPGHVDPAGSKTELPAFVSALKQGGVPVAAITTGIIDADTPNAEAILDAAAASGVTHYVWGGLAYDPAKPYQPQLDALKPRVEKLAKLNEKYKIKGLYHTASGAANVGSVFFDILGVLKNFDPRFVAIQYDTGSLLAPMRDVFVSHMRLGAAYIGGLSLNDGTVTLDLPVYDEGFYTGSGPIKPTNAGDNTGGDGGNALAIGGGGLPLPYHVHARRVGTGMIDLTLIGRTLKEIGFDGLLEVPVTVPLGGAETGADKITLPRQFVIGQIKRDRLTVEAGLFAGGWSNIDIARPAFQLGNGAGRGAAGAAAGRGGAPR